MARLCVSWEFFAYKGFYAWISDGTGRKILYRKSFTEAGKTVKSTGIDTEQAI